MTVQDNWPELAYTASDLSPYYLHEARDNMSRWRQMRQPRLSMGGWHGSGTRFLQAAAENLPERDESHDVVSCSLQALPTVMSWPGASCAPPEGLPAFVLDEHKGLHGQRLWKWRCMPSSIASCFLPALLFVSDNTSAEGMLHKVNTAQP